MSTLKWKKKNMAQYALRFAYTSGVPSAIKEIAENSGISETTVVRQAVLEKLQREGYEIKSEKSEK